MILLTNEEIFEAFKYKAGTTTFERHGVKVAKAQLKKVVEWLFQGEELENEEGLLVDFHRGFTREEVESLLDEVKIDADSS